MSLRVGIVMLIGSVLLVGGFVVKLTLDDSRTLPGLILEGRVLPSSSDPTPEVRQRADVFLDEEVVLQVGLHTERRTRRELGARIDVESASADLLRIGHSESAFTNLATQVRARRSLVRVDISASVDEVALRDALTSIALTFDRAPIEPRVEDGVVVDVPQDGRALDLEESVQRTHHALTEGDVHVVLAVHEVRPSAQLPASRALEPVIISSFVTRYRQRGDEGPRAHNVRTAAEVLDGAVIPPLSQLSFNARVGERTEAQGCRIAHVIYDGEMVDGIGGGVCQVASTLHAAALLGGLNIVRHAPHSRPSAYIPIGLDATVNWPDVDLVIANPLSVPVTVRAAARAGTMQVDLWARARPREVTWRREVIARTSYQERIIEDPLLAVGESVVTQEGGAGFTIDRLRIMTSPQGRILERVRLRYPPTDRITRRGPLPPDALPEASPEASPAEPEPLPNM